MFSLFLYIINIYLTYMLHDEDFTGLDRRLHFYDPRVLILEKEKYFKIYENIAINIMDILENNVEI